jgi:chaperone required for assembly of F1-ATPase
MSTLSIKKSLIMNWIKKIRLFSSQVHHQIAGAKRFYKKVEVTEIMTNSSRMNYGITLDGRNLKTPAKNPLIFDSYYLALAIAAEWDSQTDKRKGIRPSTMPFMTLASTAIDHLSINPDFTRSTCMSYLPTDCMLFWTKEDDELYQKQKNEFSLIIKWLEQKFNISLKVSDSVTGRIIHPTETVQTIKSIVDSMVILQPNIVVIVKHDENI